MWQLLRAGRANQAALGHRVHHGPGGVVHYSTAPAAAPDSSRSFCLSREKVTLQQLNRRLASYLQQVQCLEAANQKLECQIQEELDRKCPGELRELDGHLRTASLLQDQIGDCLSAQAQVKLQLLSAELTAFDLDVRCEKEHERRSCLEAELGDLRLLGEELMVQKLPELQSLLNNRSQHLKELQIQHQQDMQGLLAQVSGGVAVKVETAVSSDLTRQLDDLRQSSVTSERWFNTQAYNLSSPEVTFDPAAGSEVIQAELEELRSTAASLDEELTTVQALNMMLEASGLEQTESFVLQLEVLQQRADGLCIDLDSVLQAAAHMAADHQALLDVKTRLETEIEDYKRLLDGLSQHRFSGLHSNSVTKITSHCATSSPSAFRRNITVDKTVRVQGRNLMNQVHTVSRDNIRTLEKTTIVAPLSETMTTCQAIRVNSRHPKGQTVVSVNTSNRTGSFNKSEHRRAEALPDSSPVEDKVHSEDGGLSSSFILGSKISQSFQEDVGKASKSELNTSNTMLVHDSQSATSATVQAKPYTAQVVGEAEEVSATACVVSGSRIVRSEMVSSELSLINDKDIKRNEKTAEGEVVEVGGGLLNGRSDQNLILSDASTGVQNKAMKGVDTGSVIETASCGSQESNESKTAQGITTLVPDKQSVKSASVQAKPEPFPSTLSIFEAGLQTDTAETNVQNEITEAILCAESQVKQGPDFVTRMTKTDPSRETAAEVKKEADSVMSDQIDYPKPSVQARNQDPAQVGSNILETPVKFMEEDAVMSEESQSRLSSELSLMDDKDVEGPDKRAEEEVEGEEELVFDVDQSLVSNASSSKEKKLMADSDTGSSIALHCTDNNVDLESAKILKKEEEVNKSEIVNSFNDINKVKVTPAELDIKSNLPDLEASLSTKESNKFTSRTDSGVALSSSSTEEILSPGGGREFMNLTKPATSMSPEICLSPVETEILMSMNDQVFCPVDLDIRSRDSLLSPEDPEMFLSPNDPNTCLSPVEAKVCLSPNYEEEDRETCLSPTEAHEVHVRPVEKYVLTTKDEGQSLSFSGDQASPKEDKTKKVTISFSHGDSVCFGSNDNLNGTNVIYKPTSRGIENRPGGMEISGPGGRSIIADKEEQLGFGGLYRRSVGNTPNPRDGNKFTGGITNIKNVQNPRGSQGGTNGSADQKETPCRGPTFIDRTSNSKGMVTNSSMASDPASFCGLAANPSGKVSDNADANAPAGVQGRFRHGSSDWMIYGGSPGNTSTSSPNTRSEESPSGTQLPATSQPETGRFGRRGSGEWVVYGSLKRKSSLDSGISLPSKGKEEGPAVATNPVAIPQEPGRFGSRGSGEWIVYGGSLGRQSNSPSTRNKEAMLSATSPPGSTTFGSKGSGEWMVNSGSFKRSTSQAGSDGFPNTERRESLPTALHLATSPPETGRFGSRGSGEWKVYGGSTGRISSWAGSNSLPNVDSKECPLAGMQLPTSPPPTTRAGRFVSGGSGEWKVYGAGSTDRVSVSANCSRIISPPSSRTSAGSGGRLSSSGVVRRSSSVGSGGRLSSSSGSHRTSSSGRFGSTGSGEWKPVYSSASGRKSSVGSAGRSGGGGNTGGQRAPSPGGKRSVSTGSGGWLSSSTTGGNHISSPGCGTTYSSAGSSDRTSSQPGGRISSSSGSGRTNSTGGRVISSSNHPIRSTGSGAGSNKERISVCKMAALSISAARRERSHDSQRQAQKAQQQQQQQQASGTSPLVQRWLTTGVGVTSTDPEGLDDIMRL